MKKILEIADQMSYLSSSLIEQEVYSTKLQVVVVLPYNDFSKVCKEINKRHRELIPEMWERTELYIYSPTPTLDYFWTTLTVPKAQKDLPFDHELEIRLRSKPMEAYPPMTEIIWKEKASAN